MCVLELFIFIKHSLTNSLNFCYVFGGCEVWDGAFFGFGRTTELIIVLEDLGGPEKVLLV